jgi:hypothetical protein
MVPITESPKLKEERMKIRVLTAVVVFVALSLGTGTLYAANSDRFIDGKPGDWTSTPRFKADFKGVVNSDRNLGVDTKNPAEKAEINDKKVVDENPGDGAKTPAEKEEINGNEKR